MRGRRVASSSPTLEEPGVTDPRPRRAFRRIVGVIVLLSGLVWMGQGVGLIPGSFMTGQAAWIWIGLATFLGGLWLLRSPDRTDAGE